MKTTYYPEDDILEIHLNEQPVAREISYGWNIPVAREYFGKRGASIVPESKARRGGIASPIATSRNAAIGCERRASRRNIHVQRVYNISYAVDGSICEIVILEARETGLYPIATARQAA